MDTKIANLIEAQGLYTEKNAVISLLDTAVPSDPSISSYIRLIEMIAQAHSVSIFTMNTGNIPIDGSVNLTEGEQKITVSITFSGDYSGLLATLKDMESLRRPFLPTTSSLSIDESATSGAQLYLSVSGDIPYWPVTPTP
jgi:hypothetical protein